MTDSQPENLTESAQGNVPAIKRRILGIISQELLDEVKDISDLIGVSQQDLVGEALAYYVQLKSEMFAAQLLLKQLARRQQTHPDRLLISAIRNYLADTLATPTLGELGQDLMDASEQIVYVTEAGTDGGGELA